MIRRHPIALALVLAGLVPAARAQQKVDIEQLVDAEYRLHDVIHFKDMAEPVVGTILSGREEQAREISIKKAASGVTFAEKRERVERIEERQTPESAFKERAGLLAALKPPRADLHRRLAEWGLKHSLQSEAEAQLELAVAADPGPASAAHRERLVELWEGRLGLLEGPAADDLLEKIAALCDAAVATGIDSPRLRLASARVCVRLGLTADAVAELEKARDALTAKAAGPPPQDDPEPATPATPGGQGGQGGGAVAPQRAPGIRFRRDGEGLAPPRPAGGGGAPPPAPVQVPQGKPATDKSAELLAGLRRAERPLVSQTDDLLGELLLGRGDAAGAAAAFQATLAVWPEEAQASHGLARALLAQGDLAGALGQLGVALEVYPGEPELLLLRGQLLYLDGKDAEAAADLTRGLALVTDRESSLGRDLACALGLVHLVQGRFAEATPLLEQADAPPGYGPGRLALGLLAAWQGDLDKARTHYDEAARQLAPAGGEAHYLLAWALLRAGRGDDAATRLRQALGQGFDYELTLEARVELARRKGDAEAEARLLELLVRGLAAPQPDLLAGLGRAWLLQGRVDEAQGLFERGLKQDPKHRPCLRGLAACAYQSGQRTRARELFTALIQQDDKDAWAQQGLRNLEEARTRRVWVDLFEQAEVENSWKAVTDFGVQVRQAQGQLRLSGSQTNDPEGNTRLSRTVDGEVVVKFEVLLEVQSPTTRAGLRWERDRGAALVLFRDFDGKVRWSTQPDGKQGWSDPLELGDWPAQGKHALAIDVIDPQRGEVALLLDGKRLQTVRMNGFGQKGGGPVRLAIYGRGKALGDKVEAAAEEARVYVLRPEAPRPTEKH